MKKTHDLAALPHQKKLCKMISHLAQLFYFTALLKN